jgi:D-glycero-D-manno-heptose 1,7-bisphosphate phosphatase
VINEDSDRHIRSTADWIPIRGSIEAIAKLNHAGFRILVVTNQSGLGRGFFSVDALNAIHCKMRRELGALGAEIEAVFFCPHGPEEGCRCRKPRPGLLEDIERRLETDLRGVPFVGDSFRDIETATAVGASPFLVLTGKGRNTIKNHKMELAGVPVHEDLTEVTKALLAD